MNKGYTIAGNTISAPTPDPALYVVSTPIGNLGDITLRALEILAGVDKIACEDTRNTRKLLQRYAIATPLVAYHEHNSEKSAPRILDLLEEGKSVALVSDAGTPLISDPGYRLVNQVRDREMKVVPVPGASATLAALVASGLPTDSYTFLGFLPHKQGARRKMISAHARDAATLVFYESPNRLVASLEDMKEGLGETRRIAVCRELTKLYEETTAGTVMEVLKHYRANPPKGEIVILVGPAEGEEKQDPEHLLRELLSEMSVSRAAGEAARLTGLPKRELYQLALELSAGSGKHDAE